MDETFQFDDDSYEALASAGVPWQAATQIVRMHPKVRIFARAVLHTAGQARDGHWYVVTALEKGDDTYLVVGGRPLTKGEIEQIAQRLHTGDTDDS